MASNDIQNIKTSKHQLSKPCKSDGKTLLEEERVEKARRLARRDERTGKKTDLNVRNEEEYESTWMKTDQKTAKEEGRKVERRNQRKKDTVFHACMVCYKFYSPFFPSIPDIQEVWSKAW